MKDTRSKIQEYQRRRKARLAKRNYNDGMEVRADSIDLYNERRKKRLTERGIDTNSINTFKPIDKSRKKWYNNNGSKRNYDAAEVNGEKVEWKTANNGKHYAINGEGEIVAGPNAMTGRNISEVKKEAKSNSGNASAPANHVERSKSISASFSKKRGFKKEAPTFSQSIKEALDHGMSEEKIAKVLEDLKDEDIYEMNGESGVIGLAAKIDNEVVGKSSECQEMWENARRNGTSITNDVVEISKSIGATMSGLEFAVKAGKSTSEKIDRDHEDDRKAGQTERSDEEVLQGLNDVVRFTQFSPHDKLAENALNTIQTLRDKGYEIETCKNRYTLPNQEYYDIKIIARNPEGQAFELQFHSKESLDVKNKNHGLYEEQRKVGVSEERKRELGEQMKNNAASLPKPKGFEKVPQIKNGIVMSGG